ncbi:uncharacterized protein LOC124795287 [Schistocerca piceifrons]|uniref:uncharacterized protein LOC124795287 n=1 Tax=Schistocerca piceifrons TaxID=274613 RepID=UPI001F5F6191|nr:uncharacterized protein LOC124795287 [Schistocerca piceifrons]
MDQVKQMIIACIVSRKGGVPVTEIDNEYRQLVGTKIPYAKYGFPSLEGLIQSIAEIMMVHNTDGSLVLKARDTKTSHIASLVEGQKKTGNARKKVTNCYQMSAAGQNYMRGTNNHWNYGNNRGNNYRKIEKTAPEYNTQDDFNEARHRKQEMLQLQTPRAKSLFKHPTEEETRQGIETHTGKYLLKSARKENEFHNCQTRHPSKISNPQFHPKKRTDQIQALYESREEFHRSQVKEKTQRRINVDDTILVTIVNNYYRNSCNEDCSHQGSLLSDWRTDEEEREIQQDQLYRCRDHHHGYLKEVSTVRQKYRMKPSKLREPVNCYEELYVQKKWFEDSVNDCTENVSGCCVTEDSGYTHYKRDVSRKNPGLLVKVRNEYAVDRRIYTGI